MDGSMFVIILSAQLQFSMPLLGLWVLACGLINDYESNRALCTSSITCMSTATALGRSVLEC